TAQNAGVPAYPEIKFDIGVVEGDLKSITIPAQSSEKAFSEAISAAIAAEPELVGKISANFIGGKLTLTGINADVIIAETTGEDGLSKLGMEAGTTKFRPGVEETGFKELSVKTAQESDNAIRAMDAALAAVNSARATLGAVQSRFETTIENLNITNENLTASKSRIMDADF